MSNYPKVAEKLLEMAQETGLVSKDIDTAEKYGTDSSIAQIEGLWNEFKHSPEYLLNPSDGMYLFIQRKLEYTKP